MFEHSSKNKPELSRSLLRDIVTTSPTLNLGDIKYLHSTVSLSTFFILIAVLVGERAVLKTESPL